MTEDIVRRDPWGVPQLWAADVMALSRLQGLVTAGDRGWQLEVERWRAEGRVAEHLGADWVEWDVFARRARLADTAQRCFDRLDDETAQWVAVYAEGVSEGLSDTADRAQELAAAGVTPARWEPWTPIAVLLTQHVLFGALGDKLWRDRVRRVQPRAWELLCGPRHATGSGADGATTEVDAATATADGVSSSGSNAWAVAPARSATGHGWVAGDPHRMVELPGVYQQIRLACPEFDVVGLAFAGVPGVPHFAHAGEVAWGITNAMADCHDVFIEELRRSPEGVESREDRGWAPARSHREVVLVRGGDDVEVEIIETARGPVVVGGVDDPRPLSLRMVPRVEGDAGLASALALLRARSAEDVREAWQGWVEPVNAVLTADRSGTVLEFTAGLVPQRHTDNSEGPVPGWDPRHAWTGYAQHATHPVDDVAVHANHCTDQTAALGRDFASPDRAARIHDLLALVPLLNTPDHQQVHTDTFHAPADRILPRLTGLSGLSVAATALRSELLGWDRRMDADSELAHRYAVLRASLVGSLCGVAEFAGLADAADFPTLYDPWMSVPLRVAARLESLLARPPAGFDVGAALCAALEVAAAAPASVWGERHRLAVVRIGPPGEEPPTQVAVSGDRDCVLATSSLPGAADVCVQAPAARYVWDLSDRARSRWVVPHGATGTPASGHDDDQQPLWLSGELVTVPDDRLTDGPEDA
jgi:penicillin amidase